MLLLNVGGKWENSVFRELSIENPSNFHFSSSFENQQESSNETTKVLGVENRENLCPINFHAPNNFIKFMHVRVSCEFSQFFG